MSTDVITLEDCQRILRKHLNSTLFEISRCSALPFSSEVNGFMGDHFSITVKLKDGTELRFFAKRFPFQHQLQSRYALTLGAFGNEIATYDVIFEEFRKIPGFDGSFAPRFYFGRVDDVLVFEDLTLKGYRLTKEENLNSLSLEHVRLAIPPLAKYHAGSLAFEERKSVELGRAYSLLEDHAKVVQEPLFRRDESFLGYHWFKASLRGILALADLVHQDHLPVELFKKGLVELADEAFDILRPKSDYRNVLSHGDMWAKNVMYRYEEETPVACILVDFQLQRYAPPAHDVLQWIYMTTSPQTRRENLQQLLEYYYESLRSELSNMKLDIEAVLPRENFLKGVDHVLPQIKLQTAYFYSFQGANAEFHKRLVKNLDHFEKFVFGDRSPFALELFRTDPNYRELMTRALDELAEHVKGKLV